MLWWSCVAALVAIFVGLSRLYRPQLALGVVVGISLLFPAWFTLQVLPTSGTVVATGVDVKVAVCSICLLLYCWMPGRTFPVVPAPVDYLVAGLILVHLISDMTQDGLHVLPVLRAAAEWYLPYMVGRLALQSRSDLEQLWPVLASVAGALALFALIEAGFNWNPWEALAGSRPLEGVRRDASRWGIKRAYGPCLHPLYFGSQLFLLSVWVFFAAQRALRRRAAAWWLLLLPLVGLGVLATGSRGPALAMGLAAMATTFVTLRSTRLPIGIAGVAIVAMLVINGDNVLTQLEAWSGEGRRRVDTVTVDDEQRTLSGTRSRLLLLDLYKIAVRRSGLLGFGTRAVTGFPVNVPVGPQEVDTLRQLRNIDNQYVLITLRFGYLGVAMFSLALLGAILQAAWVAGRYPNSAIQLFGANLAGVLCGSLPLLFTVWMPHEIGFPLLMAMGCTSGLLVAHTMNKLHHRRSQGRPSNGHSSSLGHE